MFIMIWDIVFYIFQLVFCSVVCILEDKKKDYK